MNKLLIFVLFLSFIGCKPNAETQTQKPEEGDVLFSLTNGEVKTDESTGVPSTDIFVTSPVFKAPVLLVNDYNLHLIEDEESKETFGVPENAKFAFQSWYAGGGACYYGVYENNTLSLFKKELDEQMEEEEETPFQLVKEIKAGE